MSDAILALERDILLLVWGGLAIAAVMTVGVFALRTLRGLRERWITGLERRYAAAVQAALEGDAAARRALIDSPRRHRVALARLLVTPLVANRRPARVAATRDLFRALALPRLADRFLRSRSPRRRLLALRVLGLVQISERTDRIVQALDDPDRDVRGAALDALADLQNPASIPAIVVRLHDVSLPQERRTAALAAFGSAGEAFVLELAAIDPLNRASYARALTICGTEASRERLTCWAMDGDPIVRASAFDALARIGLDDAGAALAVAALDAGDERVRAMAAAALAGWDRPGNAATSVAAHLDDCWPVAVRAARTLRSMGVDGRLHLEAHAGRAGLAGDLARQMLWETGAGV